MDFYSKEEEALMVEFQCRISKVVVSLDGAAQMDALSAIDEAARRLAKEDAYIKKVMILDEGMMAIVVAFFSEDGMKRWLQRFPTDIQFIEKDWGH